MRLLWGPRPDLEDAPQRVASETTPAGSAAAVFNSDKTLAARPRRERRRDGAPPGGDQGLQQGP